MLEYSEEGQKSPDILIVNSKINVRERNKIFLFIQTLLDDNKGLCNCINTTILNNVMHGESLN